MTGSIIRTLARCVISVALIALGAWLVYFTWLERQVHYKIYNFTAEEADRLSHFPQAQYDFGRQAWMALDTSAAAQYFNRAVSRNVLDIEAWLRLAEVEAAKGDLEKAGKMLAFVDRRTANVYRWKWSQLLLARDLGVDEIFFRNINYMIAHDKKLQDAFQLLDSRLNGDVPAAVKVLHHDNLPDYLKWLMRWKRVDDTFVVWCKMAEIGQPDQDISLQYVNFLVGHKRIKEAELIWQPHRDSGGMTNASFEAEITQGGFDWRYYNQRNGLWTINRVKSPSYKGSYALQISFVGSENISFSHLFQIIPIESQNSYRLSYAWQSREITTDQGPFVEIWGYDCKGKYYQGPMISGTHDWQTETIEFVPPEGCEAVVVRLRRLPSKRFDSKISGTLWLDDFRLEKVNQLSADYGQKN